MVDTPHFAAHISQAVVELAVGIVGNMVEENEPLDLERAIAPEPARIPLARFLHRLNIDLHAADPMWTFADHGRRNDLPPKHLVQPVGGDLAEKEGSFRKVI